MAKRTSVAERRMFYHSHLAGKSYKEISAETGYSKECIRYWCRRQRGGGEIETHSNPAVA